MSDIQATANWAGNRRYVGRVTGRDYGRTGNGRALWMDPRDVAADDNVHPMRRTASAGLAMPQGDPGTPIVSHPGELAELLYGRRIHAPVYSAGTAQRVDHAWQETVWRLLSGHLDGPYLSVVSGTYNRLSHLQNMVNSARHDRDTYGLPIEIIIVDGGSTDGTLDWLHDQPDITTIEHGELRGAIAAFNDGAAVARGRYVVLANDDISFEPGALLAGVIFMDTNPKVGQGAYAQDRKNRTRHINRMRAQRGGQNTTVPYGQVSITRRWLGDALGWWALDGAKTYGGDTALSARVWEVGYTVEEVPGTMIHDLHAQDVLRTANTVEARDEYGRHPDTVAYLVAFPDGPAIDSKTPPLPPASELLPPARVLYAPILHNNHTQKTGLRDALRRRALVCEVDYRATGPQGLLNAATTFQPDLVLCQVHEPSVVSAETLAQLRALLPGVLLVNWDGDKIEWEQRHLTPAKRDLFAGFDLMTGVDGGVLPELGGVFLPHAFEPSTLALEPDAATPRHDVVYFGNNYSPKRAALEQALVGFDVGWYGDGWRKAAGNTHYDYARTAQIQRAAKVVICDSQWPDSLGYHSNRTMQSLAAGGALVLHQRFDGMEELGLIDGETCAVWDTMADLPDLVEYWVTAKGGRVTKRRQIADAGAAMARERHNFDVRVNNLFHLVEARVRDA